MTTVESLALLERLTHVDRCLFPEDWEEFFVPRGKDLIEIHLMIDDYRKAGSYSAYFQRCQAGGSQELQQEAAEFFAWMVNKITR